MPIAICCTDRHGNVISGTFSRTSRTHAGLIHLYTPSVTYVIVTIAAATADKTAEELLFAESIHGRWILVKIRLKISLAGYNT